MLTRLIQRTQGVSEESIEYEYETELAADAENGRVGRGQASTDATDRQPSRTGAETSIRFVNRLIGPAEVFWKRTGSQFRWPAPTWSRPAVLRSGIL
jgi:hypothetical protein